MPLPSDSGTQWPPKRWTAAYDLYEEHDAWYSGDSNRLASVFGSRLGGFWGRRVAEERRTMVHVPIAGDIAATSATLLFGEAPKAKIPEAYGSERDLAAVAAQDRLNEILEKTEFFNRILEGAEFCSSLGGVFLKPNWDKTLVDCPILNVVPADAAVPEFTWGFLTAVTFWTCLYTDDSSSVVWRHLERHELLNGQGVILHGLYKGTDSTLGKSMNLADHPETARLDEAVSTGLEGLACRYVPNRKPNRRFRSVGLPMLGRSDLAGVEGLMDSLDEVYSSWVRDIRLAQSRIIGSEEFFQNDGAGAVAFDLDKEAYVGVNAMSGGTLKDQLVLSQFAIRAEEHRLSATEMMLQIFSMAGYSPQTFGMNVSGQADSGTALRVRERKSFNTSAMKANYWKSALNDILRMMMVIDGLHLGHSESGGYQPRIEIQDGIPQDATELSNSIDMLNRAAAASIETRVRMAHPDWEDEGQIQAEVERIKDEQGVSVPDPEMTDDEEDSEDPEKVSDADSA